MLGLRPEFTASIVRAAATRLAGGPLPLRLYYHGNVFRNSRREEGSYTSQEFFQSGVELIGAGGWLADAEILLLLADCVRAVGLSNWTLLLGDVGLTESLLNPVAPKAQAAVRRAIAQLDYVYLSPPLCQKQPAKLACRFWGCAASLTRFYLSLPSFRCRRSGCGICGSCARS